MTDKARIKLAALVTALFLAAVSAAGAIGHTGAHAAAAVPVTHVASGPSQPHLAPTSHEQEHD